jgi:hypothetical protein
MLVVALALCMCCYESLVYVAVRQCRLSNAGAPNVSREAWQIRLHL